MEGLTVDEYLARSGAGESSLNTYRKLLTKCEKLIGRPLAEASKRDLIDLKAKLREKRSGPNYARRVRAFYYAMARDAEDRAEEKRFKDLAELMELKQRIKRLSPDEILTLPEVNRILAACDSLRDRALIATLWATAQRVSAVTHLRLRDLKDVPSNNGGGAIRVFFGHVKVSGEEHVSFILDHEGGDFVRTWLAAYPYARTPDAPVFPSWNPNASGAEGTVGGTPLTESGALKIVQTTGRRAGIEKRVYCHLFRHSRATYLLRKGVSPIEVKKIGGWSLGSPVMENLYAHLVEKDAYRALLVANGLEPEQAEDLGKLTASSELKAVVPLAPPPGLRPKGIAPTGKLSKDMVDLMRAFQAELLSDPESLKVLRETLGLSTTEKK